MKALKISVLGLLSLFVLVLAGLVIAMMVIDPNDHKKLAEDAVREQTGLTLTLGDIGWQFFPTIGLSVTDLALTDSALPADTQTLVAAERASVALALLPLLQQQVRVQEVTLHAPMIQHITAKDGSTNWDRLTAQSSEPPSTSEASPEGAPTLPDFNIAAFEISQANVKLIDKATGTSTQIDQLNVRLTDIALGKAIPLTFSVALQQDNTVDVAVSGDGSLTVQPDLKQFSLMPLTVEADIKRAPGLSSRQTATLSLNAQANLTEDLATVQDLALTLGELKVNAEATISQLTQQPNINSTVSIAQFSPKKWLPEVLGTPLPPTANANSLNAVSLSATLTGALTGETPVLRITPLTLTIDESTLTGDAALNLATQAIEATLNLDKMNLDHYLPPPAPDAETAETDGASTQSTEEDSGTQAADAPLIPVEALRPLNANLTFNANTLTLKEMPIEQLQLTAKANAGLIELQTFQAKLLGGNISTRGSLDVRTDTPKMKLDHVSQTVKLHPVLQAFAGKDLADGAVSLSANVATEGNSVNDLINKLVGNTEFKLEDGTLKGVNFTELAYSKLKEWGPLVSSFVPADYTQRVPPAFQKNTDIKNLLANLEFKDGKLHTRDLDADVKGSNIQGTGEFDLATLAGTLRLNLKLSESLTNPTLAQLTWPVACSFSPTSIKPDCDLKSGPVREALEKMAKRALEDKAKAALNKKLAEELRLEEVRNAEAAAKAKLKAEEEAAKAKLRAEEEAAKARLREEEQRAKERAADKVQEALQKLF